MFDGVQLHLLCRWPLLDHLSEQNLVPLILELVRAAPAEER
jgi:hypothetical protein